MSDESNPLAWAIDKATELCGSQRALAERLHTTAQEITHAKSGRRSLPAERLGDLADIIGTDRAELWQQIEDYRSRQRNPFSAARARTLTAWLVGLLVGLLSNAPNAEASAQKRYDSTTYDSRSPNTLDDRQNIHWRVF